MPCTIWQALLNLVEYSRCALEPYARSEGNPVDEVLLAAIPFQLDINQLLKTLHVDERGAEGREVTRLAEEAQAVARPKGFYRVAFVESKGDNSVVIEGVKFKGRVLSVNLDGVYRVFPFVATCGTELEKWSNSMDDVLHRYWADVIKETALSCALSVLEEDTVRRYRLGSTSVMNPGSLPDWPISEQRSLFTLLGNPEETIGVYLTDSFLMVPIKSVSGIRFPTEVHFESCQLCRRENCLGRRAPYDSLLHERRYR